MNTLQEVLEDIHKNHLFAWDLECESMTDSPKDAVIPRLARPTHVAMASANKSGCWDVSAEVMEALISCLTNETLYAFVYNATYDHAVLHHRGHLLHKGIKAKVLDVQGLAWLLDEEDLHGLKYVVYKYLRIKMTTFDDVTANSAAAKKFNLIQSEIAAHKKNLTTWKSGKVTKRPYPTFSDAPMSKTAVRKILRTEDTALTAAAAAAKVEELFSGAHQDAYSAWIEELTAKYAPALEKCKIKMNEHMKAYARDDAGNLIKLYKKLISSIRDERLEHVIEHEMSVRLETIDMRLTGMPIDASVLHKLSEELKDIIVRFEAEVYELAGQTFNVNSTDELRTLLFDKLELNPPTFKIIRRVPNDRHLPNFTPAGQKLLAEKMDAGDPAAMRLDARNIKSIPEDLREYLVCDAKVLERITHPVAQAILDYRTAVKLQSTYVNNTLDTIRESGISRLFSEFGCWSTVTGRFMSKGPNLQNIPSRGKGGDYHPEIRKKGPAIRKAFVGTEDSVLLVVDHSQIELRIIAHLAEDPNLLAVYHEYVEVDGIRFYTGDVHTQTAKAINIPRKDAKAVNFGFNYGMGPDKFAQQNRIFIPGTKDYDIPRCAKFKEGFFANYWRIQELMDYLGDLYKHGQRRFPTIAGRYRHFYAADKGEEGHPTKGTILNSCVQGSAADILKYVIHIIRKYVYPHYPGVQLICQVHDELLFLVPKAVVKEVSLLIKYAMEFPWYTLKVPVLSSAKIAPSWGAKDDDKIPEIGTYYARVAGVDRLFTEDNWDEFIEADSKGLVEVKAACAQLMPKDIAWCQTIIPDDYPKAKRAPQGNKKVLSRTDMQNAGLL